MYAAISLIIMHIDAIVSGDSKQGLGNYVKNSLSRCPV